MNLNAAGIAAWTLVATGIAAAIFAVFNRRSRRRVFAAAGVIGLVVVGLVVVMLAQMGAFCDPPAGSACL